MSEKPIQPAAGRTGLTKGHDRLPQLRREGRDKRDYIRTRSIVPRPSSAVSQRSRPAT